jgi:predicted RNA binding protein YcfA (HicA-like mRNA interferase family)
MAKLPRATARMLRRKLERAGWYIHHEGGRHSIYAHPTKPGAIPVSRHMTEIIAPGTMKSILDQAGISPEEFERL